MSGEDDQKEPASDAAASEIPEVEAEIVEEGAENGAEPFDDPAPDDDAPPAKGMLFRPGVLFFAGLVVIAVSAGVYWYVAVDKSPPISAAETVNEPTDDDAQNSLASREAETDDKITNADVADAKLPAAAPTPSTPTFDEAIDGLATPADAIANAELTEQAKEAAGEFVEPDVTPATEDEDDAPLSFEIEDETQEEIAPEANLSAGNEPQTDNTPAENMPIADDLDAIDTSDATDKDVIESDEGLAAEPTQEATLPDDDAVTSLEAALGDERARADALSAEIERIEGDLATANETLQETQAALANARAEIRTLRAENDALKKARRLSPLTDAAIALNAIEKAAAEGAPFDTELGALNETAPDAEAIATLAVVASGGAPTLGALRADFDAAARAGLAAANRENANGVIERYGARIAALFNIRPASPQPGDTPAAIISRAEHAVEKGALLKAIKEIETLPPDAQAAMKDWTGRAKQRADVDAALRLLNAELAEKAAQPESL